jgi:hypothetical protein
LVPAAWLVAAFGAEYAAAIVRNLTAGWGWKRRPQGSKTTIVGALAVVALLPAPAALATYY